MKSLCDAMKSLAVFVVAVSFGNSVFAASLSSNQKIEVKTDPAKLEELSKTLWSRFGSFCQIAEWHPAIRSCTEDKENGAVYRTLALIDGGKIKEKQLNSEPLSYRYVIVESPLPVKNYEAKFSVAAGDDKDEVNIVWSATYDPADGKSAHDATGAIETILTDGMAHIKAELPKMADYDASKSAQKTDAAPKN